MNWEAIGAIGEVVGAIAVVLTLLYLATQLRQNTRSNQTSAIQMVSAQNAEWLSLLSQPDGAAKLFYFDAAGGLQDLSTEDSARYISLIIHMCRLYDTQYHLYRMGTIPEELWNSSHATLKSTIQAKPARQAWQLTRTHFTTSFAELVDSLVAEAQEEGE